MTRSIFTEQHECVTSISCSSHVHIPGEMSWKRDFHIVYCKGPIYLDVGKSSYVRLVSCIFPLILGRKKQINNSLNPICRFPPNNTIGLFNPQRQCFTYLFWFVSLKCAIIEIKQLHKSPTIEKKNMMRGDRWKPLEIWLKP